jgi:hypothetical protein
MAVSRTIFNQATELVIDNLEGGYYHPDMLYDGRVTFNPNLISSGETLFGLDRKNGIELAKFSSWNKFWNAIDQARARSSWHYNYRGGSLEPTLKSYAEEIMYSWYNELAGRYLSLQARKLVESDPRLLFNFIYASWNGEGWFQRFASSINNAVASGITNTDALLTIAINDRKSTGNSLITQTAYKIQDLVQRLPGANTSGSTAGIFFILALATTGGYFLLQKD